FRDLAERCRDLFGAGPDTQVIDIGANDGTLLKPFRDIGCKVLGIEPSQAAAAATGHGIPMVTDYFSQGTGSRGAAEHGQAHIITAANVFAHMTDIHAIVEGIKA